MSKVTRFLYDTVSVSSNILFLVSIFLLGAAVGLSNPQFNMTDMFVAAAIFFALSLSSTIVNLIYDIRIGRNTWQIPSLWRRLMMFLGRPVEARPAIYMDDDGELLAYDADDKLVEETPWPLILAGFCSINMKNGGGDAIDVILPDGRLVVVKNAKEKLFLDEWKEWEQKTI